MLLLDNKRSFITFFYPILITITTAVKAVVAIELEFIFDSLDVIDVLPSAIIKSADEAYTLNTKGLDALEKGNNNEALKYFERALELFPAYSDAENNRGVVYYRNGDFVEAEKIWNNITKQNPSYITAYHNLGIAAFSQKRLKDAVKFFQKALDLNSRFVEARVMLGRVLLAMGEKKGALSQLKKAYEQNPNLTEAWLFYSYALLIVAADSVTAEKILIKHQDNADALRMLAVLQSNRGNLLQASIFLGKALAIAQSPSLLLDYASVQLELNNCSEALKVLNPYIEKNQPLTADFWLVAATAAKECGKIEDAQVYLENGKRFFPDDAILKYNLGHIYFLRKNYKQAEAVWAEVPSNMADPSLFYYRALNAFRMQDFNTAETNVRKAISIDEKAEYFDLLGVIAYKKGRKDEAQKNFERALSLNPHCSSARLNLSLTARKKHDIEQTKKEIQAALDTCIEDCAEKALQLSALNYLLTDLRGAIKALDELNDKEKNLDVLRSRAMYFRELHEFDEAIKTLEEAKKRFVFDSKAEYELAEAYLTAGQYSKAIQALNDVLKKWSDNPWRIYYQIGYAYFELKNFEKAKDFFSLSLQKNKNNVAAQGLLAFIFHLEGKTDQAQQLWKKNIEADPNNPTLWINIGLSLQRQGKYREALEHFEKALLIAPHDSAIHINIGNVYASMQLYREAIKAYSKARGSSKRSLALYNTVLAALKLQDKQLAEENTRILLAETPSSDYAARAAAEMALSRADTAEAFRILEKIQLKDESDWLTLAKIYSHRGDKTNTMRCLSLIPNDPEYQSDKIMVEAMLAFMTEDYDLAYKLWNELKDTSFAVRYNMALSAYHGKKYSEAFAIANALIPRAVGKDRADVCRLAGNAAFALRDWNEAKRCYLQLAAMYVNDPLIQYNLAVAYYNLGNIRESWEYYRRARELNPTIHNSDIENRFNASYQENLSGPTIDSLDSIYNKAVSYQQEGRIDEAEAAYNKILAANPSYSRAWNNLGTLYAERGELEKAEKAYMAALNKTYSLAEAYANLVNLYLAMDKKSEARRWLIKGIGHNPDSELLENLKKKLDYREK